jgi:hypothetical protein
VILFALSFSDTKKARAREKGGEGGWSYVLLTNIVTHFCMKLCMSLVVHTGVGWFLLFKRTFGSSFHFNKYMYILKEPPWLWFKGFFFFKKIMIELSARFWSHFFTISIPLVLNFFYLKIS